MICFFWEWKKEGHELSLPLFSPLIVLDMGVCMEIQSNNFFTLEIT